MLCFSIVFWLRPHFHFAIFLYVYCACPASLPFASFTCSIIYADLAICFLPAARCFWWFRPASFLRAGLMLSSNRRSRAQSGHSYWSRFRSRLHPVGASTCAFPTVKQDLVLGSSGRHEHIQHTWQLMLNANVYIATWNLNVQLVRPNRLFQSGAPVPNPASRVPARCRRLTLLKTKFVYSPQSDSLKVSAPPASGKSRKGQ